MALDRDFFDKIPLQKIIFRKIKNIAENKNISTWKDWINEWLKYNIKLDEWDLSNVFNWRKWVSSEKLTQIAIVAWINEKQLEEIVKESKKEELEKYHGVNFIPDGKVNTLEDIDFDNEELLKVMFKKEFGKELSDHDRDEILNFIKFKAGK